MDWADRWTRAYLSLFLLFSFIYFLFFFFLANGLRSQLGLLSVFTVLSSFIRAALYGFIFPIEEP